MTERVKEPEAKLHGLDDESRQMILDMVDQLRERLLTREKVLEFDEKEIFPEALIRQMLGPDIGLQLLFIPERFGGMGGGARDICAVTRKLCNICLGIGTAFFAIQLGADPLIVGGSKAQKEKWLGAIANGDALVAYAVTEAGAGSNVAAIKTKADPVYDDQGNVTAYRINGSKQFISTGGYADFITLLAIAPEGPTFFVVEKDAEGFDRGKGEVKHGIRASNTSPLTFSDVLVPVENLIGGVPGQGLKQANQVFGYTRLMVAAMALGAAEAALDIVIPYAKERIQFGAPLAEKQGYTHKLVVPHVVRLKAAATYIDEVAHRLDAGESDLQVEGSIAKLVTSEAANRAADDAIQALGGYGYITEFGVEKIKRDVKITCIYEGTSEIQQSIISTFRWKKTWKTKGGYYQGIADEMAALSEKLPESGCRYISIAANLLNRLIDLVHRNRLTKKQYIMFTLADLMAQVEVGAAVGRRAVSNTTGAMTLAEARIFANDVAKVAQDSAMKILRASGAFKEADIVSVMEDSAFSELQLSYQGLIADLDEVAGTLFGS
ncbi:MAG: acyl-CoA dehydrogenase [Deltaproteobacteria bacterium]|nr:MAG: acyl-CoA dehydrogenase [Deltaproteobacteria bacterium]